MISIIVSLLCGVAFIVGCAVATVIAGAIIRPTKSEKEERIELARESVRLMRERNEIDTRIALALEEIAWNRGGK